MIDSLKTAFKRAVINCSEFFNSPYKNGYLSTVCCDIAFENLLILAVAILIIGLMIGIGCIVAVQRKYNKGVF